MNYSSPHNELSIHQESQTNDKLTKPFLILHRHIAREDISILHSLGHVWVSGSVVQNKTADQPAEEEVRMAACHSQYYTMSTNALQYKNIADNAIELCTVCTLNEEHQVMIDS